jgi:hypothetical protein
MTASASGGSSTSLDEVTSRIVFSVAASGSADWISSFTAIRIPTCFGRCRMTSSAMQHDSTSARGGVPRRRRLSGKAVGRAARGAFGFRSEDRMTRQETVPIDSVMSAISRWGAFYMPP